MNRLTEHGNRPVVLGIVGGIAAGKSTAARLLARKGAAVIDADRLAHELLEEASIKQSLVEEFGETILDREGRIERNRLAEQAFESAETTETLNRIVHPPVVEKIRRRIEQLQGQTGIPLIVLDAPLLLETGLDRALCHKLLFVSAAEQLRRQRAQQQRAMSPEQFKGRTRVQSPVQQKKEAADYA